MTNKECKICYSSEDKMISPCLCSGSLKYIHSKCLEKYRKCKINLDRCEICKFKYTVETNKFLPIYNFILKYFMIFYLLCFAIFCYFINSIDCKIYRYFLFIAFYIDTSFIFLHNNRKLFSASIVLLSFIFNYFKEYTANYLIKHAIHICLLYEFKQNFIGIHNLFKLSFVELWKYINSKNKIKSISKRTRIRWRKKMKKLRQKQVGKLKQ